MTDEQRMDFLRGGPMADGLRLLPSRMTSREAKVLMLAISGQEAGLIHQQQIGGPAVGLMQFEKGGGVAGVMRHHATKEHAMSVCAALGVEFSEPAVYAALKKSGGLDVLDFAFGRLLLFSHPKALPRVGDSEAAWQYYLATWRPGQPHRGRWDYWYNMAVNAIG